jgi:hypothetical protein
MASEEMHTFILRLSRGADGRLRGVLERVRTGEKVLVQELETLGPLVGHMLRAGEHGQIHATEGEP